MHKLIIIGSGPAGLTAAIYAARADLNPVIIEGSQPGGQLVTTSMVENWPGEDAILGPQLMLKMHSQAKKLGAISIPETVIAVDKTDYGFLVKTNKNEYLTKAVIAATGSSPKKIGCIGEKEYWGKGVTTCAVCDGAFYRSKPVAIIGGGDTALEDASFMTKFTDNITILQILDKLTGSKALQKRVLNNPKIKIIYNAQVTKFLGDDKHLKNIEYKDTLTEKVNDITVDAAFIAIGLKVNNEYLPKTIEKTELGNIINKCNSSQSSIPGLFVAGDLIDINYRQAITAAGSGCKAALDAEKYLEKLNDK